MKRGTEEIKRKLWRTERGREIGTVCERERKEATKGERKFLFLFFSKRIQILSFCT